MIRNKIAQDVFGSISDVEGENSNTSDSETSNEGDDLELKRCPVKKTSNFYNSYYNYNHTLRRLLYDHIYGYIQ